MKILVLQGSPHKNGSSNLLAEQFVKGAREKGHEISEIDTAHLSVGPCLGCDHCRTEGSVGVCVRNDDYHLIRDNIEKADMLVFVTPLYYFGFSAQLKAVIDRFYCFNKEIQSRGLKSALIAAAADTDDDALPYLQLHYLKICRYLRFENLGTVLGKGCGDPEKTAKSEYMNEAYKLGKSI